jgi:hypothetical protein
MMDGLYHVATRNSVHLISDHLVQAVATSSRHQRHTGNYFAYTLHLFNDTCLAPRSYHRLRSHLQAAGSAWVCTQACRYHAVPVGAHTMFTAPPILRGPASAAAGVGVAMSDFAATGFSPKATWFGIQ